MANGVNDRAFSAMETAASDKTRVDLFPQEIDKSTKGIHNALMAAGMTPAYGNVADLADATLYALEGEFGDAVWSAAAAIPVIGQMVAGKRALKIAKESGEEMVTVYRGIPRWFPRTSSGRFNKGMVKEGKFIGGGGTRNWGGKTIEKTAIWVTDSKEWASSRRYTKDAFNAGRGKKGYVLEFEMPKSYFNKYSEAIIPARKAKNKRIIFQEGIPKEYLKKVHK
jgi:hypothetical protein